jgi:hypothetical protein
MDDMEKRDRTTRIRNLNNAFRQTFAGGRVMLTSGVDALPDLIKARALQLVRIFDDFSEDNDPHGEHDLGSFELANFTFFWKIDYYDPPVRVRFRRPSRLGQNNSRPDDHA